MPQRHRILVVDDDPGLVRVVTLYLTIEGFDVDTASDGEEALRHLAAARADLVILDVMMAGMDGLEACRRIKANPQTGNIPVILFTALNRDEDLRAGRAAGADSTITKPFSLVGLGSVIKAFLGSRDVPAVG